MSIQQNVQTVQDAYSAFGRGDIPFILTKITDDVNWVSHMDSVIPWSGSFPGKECVPEFFEAIYKSVDVLAFVPKEHVAEGDTVVSIGEFECRNRANGKTAHTRWIFVWKFRDGLVCSYEQFHSPTLAEAFR